MPVFVLSDDLIFPPAHLANKEGLLAVGGDLKPDRILLAYKNGIFPWYSDDDPILWWSPDPRLVLYLNQISISKSLKKRLRDKKLQVSMDCRFRQVIEQCAQSRVASDHGTWITSEMIEAYCRLNELGYAHSVEVICQDKLVGGLYGLSLGRCFFGESMFTILRDASKVALVHLSRYLKNQNINLIDCQVSSNHLKRLGAITISRADYLSQLQDLLQYPTVKGPWCYNR